MSGQQKTPAIHQRNALAPSLIAAAVLFVAPVLIESDWGLAVRFIVTILGLIIAWFAFQAKHWWWIPVFAVVAVLWNPIFPFAFTGPVWGGAQVAAALAFLAAGSTIKVRRT